ncbi:DEAD-box ATP-dependent RNA helicase CshE [Choanephora cucurbitarum]|uniref:RNA helicase n=1 Tax=Choanephora cucurbitarum TaxID=101091 RepID=A0A1C7NJU6_9FUNG|nr:DEAD-box ATP-dependent RNA helicase CshE [Choanephora cucurbitarum]
MLSRHYLRTANKRHYSTFESLGISGSVTKRLKAKFNVTRPTLAQEQFIPVLVHGQRDLLIRDRTGTGKTFGTALTLASLIQPQQHGSVSSLYIVPNQELAYQITYWIQELTDNSKHVQVMADATTSLKEDIPHTLIGTPGRILNCLDTLPIHRLERLILDEADQALSLPKRYATIRQQNKRLAHPKPTERLLDRLPKQHQTLISSATLNRPLRHFLIRQKGWLRDPLFVDFAQNSQLKDDGDVIVRHHCLLISDTSIRNIRTQQEDETTLKKEVVDFDDTDDRMIESLAILQEIEPVKNGILFVGPTVSVSEVQEKLAKHNILAEDIKTYKPSQTHQSRLWIATEFAARGVDMPNVSHVFILGKPASVTSYLHMAGRTGRLGPSGFGKGKVFNLVRAHGWNESKMLNLYNLLNIPTDPYEHVE